MNTYRHTFNAKALDMTIAPWADSDGRMSELRDASGKLITRDYRDNLVRMLERNGYAEV